MHTSSKLASTLRGAKKHSAYLAGLTLALLGLTSLAIILLRDSRNQLAPLSPATRGNSVNGADRPKLATGAGASLPTSSPALSQPERATQAQVRNLYSQLPMSFEANHGQTDAQVKFLSRGSGYSLFLTPTEAVLSLRRDERRRMNGELKTRHSSTAAHRSSPSSIVRMRLVGANAAPQATGFDELPGKSNYFIGNDPKQWRTDVPTYAGVQYRGVYPGVDLVYYGRQRQLEYDLVIAPGADPHSITLGFAGAREIRIDAQGDLVLHTAGGEIRQHQPLVYQQVGGIKRAIAGRYVFKGKGQVGFWVAEYDRSQSLVIDPVLSYSTYLGGSSLELGNGIAVDSSGNAYVTGETASTDFPKMNAAQSTFGGGTCGNRPCNDAFVAKLNATGSALVYSTYLGGSNFDEGLSIAIDSVGNAYVTGTTNSPTFPTTPGAFQTQ